MLAQLEGAKMKLLRLVGRRDRSRLDQRERRIGKLGPDGKVVGRDRQPSEAKHITAGFIHMSRLLPSDFIDHRFPLPFDVCGVAHRLPAGRLKAARRAPAPRTYRDARRTWPSPASTGSIP